MRVHLTNDRMNAQLKLIETHDRLNCDAVVYISNDWAVGPSAIFVTDWALADMRVYVTTDALAADADAMERANKRSFTSPVAYDPPQQLLGDFPSSPGIYYNSGSYTRRDYPPTPLRIVLRDFALAVLTWVFGFLLLCGIFGIFVFLAQPGWWPWIWWPMLIIAGSTWVLYKIHGKFWEFRK